MVRNRTAACLAVGSELLGEDRLDRNSLTITATLARYGVSVVEKRVVGDSIDAIAGALDERFTRLNDADYDSIREMLLKARRVRFSTK